MTRVASLRVCADYCCRITLLTLAAIMAIASGAAHAGPFGFQRIAHSFHSTPPNEPATAQYDYFGIPAVSGGAVVFGDKVLGQSIGGAGNFTRIDVGTTAGGLTNYAKYVNNPGPNPPVGTIAFFFDDPSIYGNQIATRPSAYNGTNYSGQVFIYNAPNVPTSLGTAWGPPSTYFGNTAFAANRVGINTTQIQGTFIDSSDLVPGGGGATFQSFSPYGGTIDSSIDYNIGQAAFVARWVDTGSVSRVGVYRWQNSTDTFFAIADKNVSIPGFPLDKFDDNNAFVTTHFDNVSTTGVVASARPSLAGSTVLFSYNEIASSPPRAGVYRHAGGSLAKVADVTTTNPSTNQPFRHFEGVSTLGTAHAFVANSGSISSAYGIYMDTCGMISEVTRQGNLLDGRTISNLEIGHRALSMVKFKYNLAFRAEFTDGTEGIYVASTNFLCYDPVPVLADFGGNFGGTALVTLPPEPGIGVPVEATWQMRTLQGPAGIPATVGVDFEQGLVGVNGLAGNNPNLIDFTMEGGAVAPEELSLSFNEDMYLDNLRFGQFDLGDSLQVSIGGVTRIVDAVDVHDGMLELGGALLAKGEALRIAWDGGNASGNGVSFNGLGYHVVPEPGALVLLSIGVLVLRGRCAARC